MPTRFTIVCDDGRAREIRRLARKFDLTEEETLRQLVELPGQPPDLPCTTVVADDREASRHTIG